MPSNMPTITADVETFLRGVFGRAASDAWVTSFPGDPAPDGRWAGWRAGSGGVRRIRETHNAYYVVSTFKSPGRRMDQFAAMHVLMVDDVGTKLDRNLVTMTLGAPTFRVETSPGNEQWGYVFDLPLLDFGQAEALISGAISALTGGAGADPGMASVTRYARLPVGINGKAKYAAEDGSLARVTLREWAPSRTFTPDELAVALGVTLPAPGSVTPGSATARGRGLTREELTRRGIDTDPVLEAMNDLGWLRGWRSNGWGIECTCPCVSEHTDGTDNGCAYQPGPTGGWKCHHGHCSNVLLGKDEQGREIRRDRPYDQFYRALDHELREAGLPDMARREFEPVADVSAAVPPRRAFLDEFVYLRPDNAFYSTRSRQVVPRPSINLEWASILGDELEIGEKKDGSPVYTTADRWFHWQPDKRVADVQSYWPGKPAVFEQEGTVFINRWREPWMPTQKSPVSKHQIAPWLDLVKRVAGSEGGRAVVRFLDWMAAVVADPSLKPAWFVVVQGKQGIGKDMVMGPVQRAVGPDNVALVRADQVTSQFTSWTEKRLVVMRELKQTSSGTATAHDQYTVLKGLVDVTQEWIDVNPKYGKPYRARNTAAIYVSTNEEVPLTLEESDRRTMVLASTAAPLTKDEINALVPWFAQGGDVLVVQWLRERWARLTANRRGAVASGHAPMTAGKRTMLRAAVSGGDLGAWIADRLAEPSSAAWPDLMAAEDVMANIARAQASGADGLPRGGRCPSARVVGKIMAAIGCVRAAKGEPVQLRDGRRLRIWATRDTSRFASLGGAAVASCYAQRIGADFTGSEVVPLDRGVERASCDVGTEHKL